jgi:3-keto-5-aminohexanoate cleavage enzyme
MEKLIITAAVCGSGPTRDDNPNIPYTPAEIAAEALRCWRAGAAIVHVHVRDPRTGEPAFERHLFSEVVERVRADSDMLINLTTSAFNLEGPDAGEKRLMPVELAPDLCSLDVGSLNFRGGRVFINPADWVETAAGRMRQAGVKPEMEVFDTGHLRQACNVVKKGLIEAPPYFQICLGVPWGAEADVENLLAFKTRLPAGSQWSVLGIASTQLPVTTHALLLGGHVRVGFEDNVYLRKGVLADSSARFVERTVSLAGLLEREVASCGEARAILGIPARH